MLTNRDSANQDRTGVPGPIRAAAIVLALAAALLVAIGAAGHTTIAEAQTNSPSDSDVLGDWSELGEWPFVPLHAALDADGQVFSYGRADVFDVWDPTQGFTAGAHTTTNNNTGSDLFCSFTAYDTASSGLLVMGGDPTNGVDNDFTLRYRDGTLTDLADPMHFPRWYPTATTLPDGRILVQGGVTHYQGDPIITPEIWIPGQGWKLLTGAQSQSLYGASGAYNYPRTWMTPAGKIFSIAASKMYYIDPDGNNGQGKLDILGNFPSNVRGGSSAAVMFDTGKVLQVGGGGVNKAVVIDLNFDPPKVTPTASTTYSRLSADATVLADGRVLVSGGSRTWNQADGVATHPEIWDPATGQWTVLRETPSELPRLYHSSALLLPDATVWIGGGGSPGPVTNTNAEIYYPPYIFNGNGSPAARPVFSSMPDEIGHSGTFTAQVDAPVATLAMVRHGNSTHSTNTQTWQELEFAQSGSTISFQAPTNRWVAPPGDYQVFAIGTNGVPSVAALVSVREGVVPPAPVPTATPVPAPTATPIPPPTATPVPQPPSEPTLLSNGTTVGGLRGRQGDMQMFAIDVPAGATDLSFSITGGTGDGDIYVRQGAAPTTSEFDCFLDKDGNEETCDPPEATEGRWYVGLRGYQDFDNISLTASFDVVTSPPPAPPVGGQLQDGEPVTGISGDRDQQIDFFVDVPADVQNLMFTTTGGTGDADLYVRHRSVPTLTEYSCRPWVDGNEERCATESLPGRWHVSVVGYGDFNNVTLTVNWDEADQIPTLQVGESVTGLAGAEGEMTVWAVDTSSPGLTAILTGGTGDADVYVRRGNPPTLATFDCFLDRDGNEEVCEANGPAGRWYVAVRGYANFDGVTLTTEAG